MTHTAEYMRAWRAAKAAEGRCHGCFHRAVGERVGKFRGTRTLCGLCAEERRAYGRAHYTPAPVRVLKKQMARAAEGGMRADGAHGPGQAQGRAAKPRPPTREERTAIRIEKLLAAAARLGKLEGIAVIPAQPAQHQRGPGAPGIARHRASSP